MFHNKNKLKKKLNQSNRGFGLIEMMVSIGIIVLVMTIVMTRHDAFNSAILLRAQAYEVALQAREIQLSAVSVTGDSANFRISYGLHFPDRSSFYNVFSDSVTVNNKFDSGEEFGKQGILDRRFVINEIRLNNGTVITTPISVLFERPNFDAHFFDNSGAEYSTESIEIDICLRTTPCTTAISEVRTVEITRTGQISVQ